MVLQKADHIVKTMLCDTILALCRNTLPYEGEFCVEGLLGITMDNKEIFLVNINETIQKEGANKTPSKRKAAEEESRESDDVSSQDSDSDSQSPSKSKRKRKRKRRSREGSNQCFETSEMNEEKHSDPSGEEDSRLSANLIKNETENEDSRLSGDHMKHEQEQHHYIDDDNDEDIVFVKEEPKDYDTSCSYGPVSFPTPGGSTTGQSDSTGLGQLHELAMQLSGDISSSSLNTLGAMASQPSAAFQETSVSGNNQDSAITWPRLLSSQHKSPGQLLNIPYGTLSWPKNAIGSEETLDKSPGEFRCHVCHKWFASNKDLVRHIRIHTGEKPFKCHICGKRFAVNGNLKTHIRIHTGEKPHKCPYCDKGFLRRSAVQAHIVTLHQSSLSQQ